MLCDTNPDEYFMGEALKEAQKAFDKGEVPVGAVIVRENRIIARAHNQVEMLKDATAHAEILAITQAESALVNWRLEGTTLFVTKEPCFMCSGAILQCRVKRVVYGAKDEKSGGAGGALDILRDARQNHRVEVKGGVLEEPARILLQEFFKIQRVKKSSDTLNN